MHKSSRLQKNSGSGPLQARLELWRKEVEEEEDAKEWLETRSRGDRPEAMISEGMRALTVVAAASESNSRARILKLKRQTRTK